LGGGKKEKILKEIVEIEYSMFLKMNTSSEECRKSPEAFRLNREARFFPLSTQTLSSYLDDLLRAEVEGRNLLTEKYARIEGLIPPLQENPVIHKIVEIESEWIKELSEEYPELFSRNPEKFRTYLACELETFSEKTLRLYFIDVKSAREKGINLAEESYKYLFKKSGFSSFEEVRKRLKNKERG